MVRCTRALARRIVTARCIWQTGTALGIQHQTYCVRSTPSTQSAHTFCAAAAPLYNILACNSNSLKTGQIIPFDQRIDARAHRRQATILNARVQAEYVHCTYIFSVGDFCRQHTFYFHCTHNAQRTTHILSIHFRSVREHYWLLSFCFFFFVFLHIVLCGFLFLFSSISSCVFMDFYGRCTNAHHAHICPIVFIEYIITALRAVGTKN